MASLMNSSRQISPPSPVFAPEQSIANHVSVCICTFKRPTFLKRLLDHVAELQTGGRYTYSIVVVDNDPQRSGEAVCNEFMRRRPQPTLTYCVQPQQSIALTRNKAIEVATGEFIAFIDDDEFPVDHWLLELYLTCTSMQVAGALGPVKRHFDQQPPSWILKGSFFERPTHPTGFELSWRTTRTGNVLFRRDILEPGALPFRPEFRGGSDVDFFRLRMAKGHRFVWCNDAVVYESIPPARWKRRYMLRRALLGGIGAALRREGFVSTAKSIIAVPLYTLVLPFALLLGHHRFMTLLIKTCNHLGKLLRLAGVNPIKDAYVTD
jgi:glycosyltransferase involved in cell wall biosynthesis